MTTALVDSALAQGYEALATGDWATARSAFEESLAAHPDSPDALDGLGRSLWWLRDGRGAIVSRERAYAGFRRVGDLARAARLALWLSREYGIVYGNEAAARGWLARADRLLRDVAPGAEQGWLDLARSETARAPEDAAALARSVLRVAATAGDPDLELRALAQLGLALVTAGDVDEGLAQLDEAMAAATGGEPTSLETFADICCTLLLACERAGDSERPQQWSSALADFARRYDHVVLLAFCRTCCADVFAANGRIDAAEEELVAAIRELSEAGERSRCVNPSARLAEIRVLQGRFDEAEQLLAGYEDEPDATRAAVLLRLARGEPAPAAMLLERRLADVGRTSLLAAPLLDALVDARLAEEKLDDAARAAAELADLGAPASRDRARALGLFARGRIAAARGDDDAAELLRDAVNAFASLGLRLDAARCRLALARVLADTRRELAVDAARQAHNELDALGAARDADVAAALLRSLGAKSRSGPRAAGLLTRRELEILRLLGEGLTNREIAARLHISPKTAEHHVSRIYAKVGVAKRAEAAAYATRYLDSE